MHLRDPLILSDYQHVGGRRIAPHSNNPATLAHQPSGDAHAVFEMTGQVTAVALLHQDILQTADMFGQNVVVSWLGADFSSYAQHVAHLMNDCAQQVMSVARIDGSRRSRHNLA